MDVIVLLFYIKGKEFFDEAEFEFLGAEMKKLGIEVGMKGVMCMLL